MHLTAIKVTPISRLSGATLIGYGILALMLVRLVTAWATPLASDEAYYWMLSRHPAGGYYDHPPMAVLLIRFSTWIFGDTEFGVRV